MKSALRISLLAVTLIGLPACDSVMTWLSGAYDGPLPAREDLVQELVVVREVEGSPGQPQRLTLDRVRYLDAGRPHAIDRVIFAYIGRAMEQLVGLELAAGDSLVVDTDFFQMGEGAGDMRVPNWPGRAARKSLEYPVGAHWLVSVRVDTRNPGS